MKINEITVSNTYDYKLISDMKGIGRKVYSFVTDDNREIHTSITLNQDRKYPGYLKMELEFKDQENGFKTTGTGDAFKILGTVKKILTDYWKSINVDSDIISRIIFSADSDETSRVKLYSRIAPQIISFLDLGMQNFEVKKYSDTKSTYYEITRKEF